MTFKEKIVKLRKMKGLTQDEFASAVGVSRQAVYKWESGQSYPEVSKLLEIKILFNISIDDLLDESYEVVVPEKKKKRNTKKAENASREDVAVKSENEETLKTEEVKAEIASVKEETESFEPATNDEKEEPSKIEEKVQAKEEEKKLSFFGRLFGRK